MTDSKKYFTHEHALCESTNVGAGTRVWAFAHVLPNAKIGEDCNICDHVFVENDVILGDRVTVKCGVQIWDGVRIEDDVFIGPNVTFTNDLFPRSKKYPDKFANTIVRKGASLGANATLLPGITIGQDAMIGAGAVVTRSVPPNAIVVGNPAKIVGYVDAADLDPIHPINENTAAPSVSSTSVPGVTLHTFRTVPDMRGSLSAGEFQRDIPFSPLRYFLVFDVPTAEVRGEHAHRECHQFLIAVKGSVRVVADNGNVRQEFVLNKNNIGLYLPPMVWGIQYHYSPDAVLLVFASHHYDPDDYIRDYSKYIELVACK
ncbi:isomerase [Pusillimonas sp. TS35]|nr:isomerase [Pusillimonas sp. TS35]